MIAALFVQTNGAYFGMPDVDPWDEARDARRYNGPHPVIAHPPCARWCQLAAVVEKRYGLKRGDDGGTFASALASVRRYGGVLEHPAWSAAFAAHGLPQPSRHSWQRTFCGGWVTHVEQGRYGHRARKGTWLYAVGASLPVLDWAEAEPTAWVSGFDHAKKRERVWQKEASATPPAFREVLLGIARSVTSFPVLSEA